MPLELAPDGIMRWKPILSTKYIFHGSIVLPRVWLPARISEVSAETIEFTGGPLLLAGTSTPHIWGRRNNLFLLRDVVISDTTGNTKLFDLVGASPLSILSSANSSFSAFADLGYVRNMPLLFSTTIFANLARGLTTRFDDITQFVSIFDQVITSSGASTGPQLFFGGTYRTVSITSSTFAMPDGAQMIAIDSAATGTFEISGNAYDGVSEFFQLPISNAITAFANVDKTITAVADSTDDPGVDSTIFVAAHGFKIGQTVLIDGVAATYDGSHVITRVALDEASFDIAVVFVATTTGDVKITRVTDASNKLCLDQTITISGTTSYNTTTSILTIVDVDTFDIPIAFVADDATGFAAATAKNQTNVSVFALGNGQAANSAITAEAILATNALVTDIPAVNALVLINATTWTGEGEERMSVGSDGHTEYTGLFPDAPIKLDGNITLEPASSTKMLAAQFGRQDAARITVTFTNGTNIVNETSTPLVDGDNLTFHDNAGTLPAELREDIVYFVVSQATNTFQVSYTSGGSAIAFTDDGSGTNTYAAADMHGSAPSNSVASNNPRTVVPHALESLSTGDSVFVAVKNEDDAIDIEVTKGYYRMFA